MKKIVALMFMLVVCASCCSCSGVLHPSNTTTIVVAVADGEDEILKTLLPSTESGYVLLPLNEGETLTGEKVTIQAGDVIKMFFDDSIFVGKILTDDKTEFVYNQEPTKIVVAIRNTQTKIDGEDYLISIGKTEIEGDLTVGAFVATVDSEEKVGYKSVIDKIEGEYVVVRLGKNKIQTFVSPLFDGSKLKVCK